MRVHVNAEFNIASTGKLQAWTSLARRLVRRSWNKPFGDHVSGDRVRAEVGNNASRTGAHRSGPSSL